MSDDPREIGHKLAAPFPPDAIGWKPGVVKDGRCLAMAHLDARDIMDRLDDVVGPDRWQDSYTPREQGIVECHLSVKFGDQWITHSDVGGESDQKDEDDRAKAAYSAALKRAGVKFGIGRYLYRLPAVWCDYDPKFKRITNPPRLPDWAMPKVAKPAPKAPKPDPEPKSAPKNGKPSSLPATGAELLQRLRDFDAKLAGQGMIGQGELVRHVTQQGVKAGHPADIAAWSGAAIQFAVDQAKAFDANLKTRAEKEAAEPIGESPAMRQARIALVEASKAAYLCGALTREKWVEALADYDAVNIDELTLEQRVELAAALNTAAQKHQPEPQKQEDMEGVV